MTRTVLLFAGQGAQQVGMGKDLAAAFPSAAAWFEKADALLGYPLSRICFEGPESELTRTENAQPAIFLVSWVAFQLLREHVPGLRYAAAAGLSLGEITALTAAGAISFEDGLRLLKFRSQFMQEACDATQGGMAAVLGLDRGVVESLAAQAAVAVANYNCPGQIVISGPQSNLPHAIELAKQAGAKRVIPLNVAGAYHSPLMAPAAEKLAKVLDSIPVTMPAVEVISNVTARPHTTPGEIKSLLVRQVTAPVRWEDSVRYLLEQGFTRFIELGPGTVLTGFLKRIANGQNLELLNVADVPSLNSTVAKLRACTSA